MSEMVERVARALCTARGLDPDRVSSIGNSRDDGGPEASVALPAWMNFRAAARAAIEAMREPTLRMICEVQKKEDVCAIDLERPWRFMIDAALKEST